MCKQLSVTGLEVIKGQLHVSYHRAWCLQRDCGRLQCIIRAWVLLWLVWSKPHRECSRALAETPFFPYCPSSCRDQVTASQLSVFQTKPISCALRASAAPWCRPRLLRSAHFSDPNLGSLGDTGTRKAWHDVLQIYLGFLQYVTVCIPWRQAGSSLQLASGCVAASATNLGTWRAFHTG